MSSKKFPNVLKEVEQSNEVKLKPAVEFSTGRMVTRGTHSLDSPGKAQPITIDKEPEEQDDEEENDLAVMKDLKVTDDHNNGASGSGSSSKSNAVIIDHWQMDDQHVVDTCHSMDFIGISINDGTLPLTSDVRVGLIDAGDMVRASHTMKSPYLPSLEPVKFQTYQKRQCDIKMRFSGHGNHCASILCGRVQQANLFDICEGSVRGVLLLPKLHLYAICRCSRFCRMHGSLMNQAISDAISDGVQVISMSIGKNKEKLPENYEKDSIGPKTLEALRAGILTCKSAGNNGPSDRSLYGVPWVLSVGACASGKLLVTRIEIGIKGETMGKTILGTCGDINIIDSIEGVSFNLFDEGDFHQLEIPKNVRGQNCLLSSPEVHDDFSTLSLYEDEKMDFDVSVTPVDRPKAIIHRNSTNQLHRLKTEFGNVYVRIKRSKFRDDGRKAVVPTFSSRGPSNIFGEFIKPELVAPGYGIVSFWPVDEPILESDQYGSVFNDQMAKSGTSMACPHVAGAAVMVKEKYPDLSPMGIISALVTTAKSFAEEGIPGNELTYGAGLVQLMKAISPGLVYIEIAARFEMFLQNLIEARELNLPSFCASLTISRKVQVCEFPRELTYIGESNGPVSYRAETKIFRNLIGGRVLIKPVPDMLTFNHVGEKKKFTLFVKAEVIQSGFISAILRWKSPGHNDVSSPIHLYEKHYYGRTSVASTSKRPRDSGLHVSNQEECVLKHMEKLSLGMEEQCSASYSGQNDD